MLLKFSDLFDGLDSAELRYSGRCAALAGQQVELKGYLSKAHPDARFAMLVSEPGVCPDCSPVPVACVALPGFSAAAEGAAAVRLRGRLSYGLERDEDGNASYLRLEEARIATGLSA